MCTYFKKIIDLIQKTGDKCIVVDPQNQVPYVVMNLKDYEELVFDQSALKDLTEGELLDKINHDIAIWKSSQEDDNLAEFRDFGQDYKDEYNVMMDERYYFEPVE